jgi:DNA-binding transcriptional regulator LsrR (DeoR family)/ADP-ribosylglycohydrolase
MSPSGRLHQLYLAAQLYYVENWTQDEIAQSLGVSRPTVSRLIAEARRENLVQITVINPSDDLTTLAEALKERLGLAGVVVAPGQGDNPVQIRKRLGLAAAQFLASALQRRDRLGVGWGRTLHEVAEALETRSGFELTVVPLIGGLGQIAPSFQVHALARTLAEKLGGVWHALYIPAIVEDGAARATLLNLRDVAHIVEMWDQLDVAIVGIGDIDLSQEVRSLFADYLDTAALERLKQHQAVGDICMHFYDSAGLPLPHALDGVLSIEPQRLQRVPRRIGVAGGRQKVEAILGAARGGLINVLITDESAAHGLLALTQPRVDARAAPGLTLNTSASPAQTGSDADLTEDRRLTDAAAGMLAGVAVGDALGMPSEFLPREVIRDWYGEVADLRQADARHPHSRLPAGSVTDDTDQTLILARLLLAHGEIRPEDLAAALLAWSQTPRVAENNFVGPSTRKVLAALQAGVALDQLPRQGASVGAAMRTAPLAIALTDPDQLVDQVVASCSLTHFTRNAISGAMAMAFGQSAALLPGANPATVIEALKAGAVRGREIGDWSWAPPIERRIDFVVQYVATHTPSETLDLLADIIGVDLCPEQLVPATAGLLLLSDGQPMPAMRWAANLGGDTDTLACMVGSLCGGLTGLAGFAPDWLRQVELVNSLDVRALARDLVASRRPAVAPVTGATP